MASAEITDDENPVSPLELFFDLVYVFAITKIAGLIHHDHSATGFANAALILAMTWWAWSQYTWAINAIGTDRKAIRIALLAAMGATLAMGIGIPEAFGSAGAWFGITYFSVRAFGLVIHWLGLRHDPEHQAALRTFIPLSFVASSIVLVGGFTPEAVRPWIWLVAFAVDIASAINAGRGGFRVAVSHFAERHQLFVIIALGEIIVAAGLTAGGVERTGWLIAALISTFFGAGMLWWSYFDWASDSIQARLLANPIEARAMLARDFYTFLHYPIVAGIILYAIAAEAAIAHPEQSLPDYSLVALGAGIGLFLFAFVAGTIRGIRRVLIERVVIAAAVGAFVATFGTVLNATLTLFISALIIAVGLGVESRTRARQVQAAAAVPAEAAADDSTQGK